MHREFFSTFYDSYLWNLNIKVGFGLRCEGGGSWGVIKGGGGVGGPGGGKSVEG